MILAGAFICAELRNSNPRQPSLLFALLL